MSEHEKTYSALLNSLSPDELRYLAVTLAAQAEAKSREAVTLSEMSRQAAELAKFKGLDS